MMYNDPSDAQAVLDLLKPAPDSFEAAADEPSAIDRKIEDEGSLSTIAGGPLDEKPEFRQHECWRMLHVWPDEVDQTLPGRLECPGCGAVFRVELEYKP